MVADSRRGCIFKPWVSGNEYCGEIDDKASCEESSCCMWANVHTGLTRIWIGGCRSKPNMGTFACRDTPNEAAFQAALKKKEENEETSVGKLQRPQLPSNDAETSLSKEELHDLAQMSLSDSRHGSALKLFALVGVVSLVFAIYGILVRKTDYVEVQGGEEI